MHSDSSYLKKLIYIIPLLPVYFIIISVVYGFSKFYASSDSRSFIKFFICLIFYICAIMTIITHTYSIITSPGKAKEYREETKTNNPDSPKNKDLFCSKCNRSRPIRSHHCKVCNTCILKMDHHCPWIANCVGFRNQKFFYLFLFYATFGNLIGSIVLIVEIFSFDFPTQSRAKSASLSDSLAIVISTILAVSMTFSIGFLFTIQTSLILENSTSIENMKFKQKKDNPFYSENRIKNLKIVLGLGPWYEWFIPIFRPNSYNNGISYLNSDQIVSTNQKLDSYVEQHDETKI